MAAPDVQSSDILEERDRRHERYNLQYLVAVFMAKKLHDEGWNLRAILSAIVVMEPDEATSDPFGVETLHAMRVRGIHDAESGSDCPPPFPLSAGRRWPQDDDWRALGTASL